MTNDGNFYKQTITYMDPLLYSPDIPYSLYLFKNINGDLASLQTELAHIRGAEITITLPEYIKFLLISNICYITNEIMYPYMVFIAGDEFIEFIQEDQYTKYFKNDGNTYSLINPKKLADIYNTYMNTSIIK